MENKRSLGAKLRDAFVSRPQEPPPAPWANFAGKSFLHVGCGGQTKMGLKGFDTDTWNEIRFDIDKKANPDILGTLTDMSQVPSSSVDALYSSHNIEHVFAHEVPVALKEFNRVLKPDGFLVITCPDLESVCSYVAQGHLTDPLYDTPAGMISAHDILYGHGEYIANGRVYMAHKCGFTFATLQQSVLGAGFEQVVGCRRPDKLDLWVVGFKQDASQETLQAAARAYLP